MIKAKVFIFIVKTFYIIIVTRYSLLQVEFMFQNQIAQISLSKHRLVIELLMYLVFMKSISRTDKKGPACNIHMSPGNVNHNNIVFVYIEDTNNKWMDIKVFHPISVTAGYEVRIQTGQQILDSPS